MTALLDVKDLTISFGGNAVVHGINFSIAQGEKLALVGESGSGKTVTALSLLRLADVDLAELAAARGYEETKSRLESLSASITDAVLKYWARDHGLEVEFDVRADPTPSQGGTPPGEDGPNLYVRVKDKRHRVSLPLGQRSKGFVWFFSFVVRFETIQRQAGPGEGLILLLDEPGLNLHALAQIDFLRYIEALSGAHQVVYTTHSPFMIPGDRLDRVRLVEDRPGAGTVVTTDLAACDARTVFPLQAALGTAIARAVLPARRNLLVEGLADVVTLKVLSAALEKAGRTGLRGDVAVVPMGGLKRLATFLALLGPGELELVVLSGEPLAGGPDGGSARELLARQKRITGYGRYRTLAKGKVAPEPPPESAGVEDLFTPAFYLKQVSAAYAKALGNKEVKEADLPAGERLVARLASHLAERGTPFTRDAVADHLALNPPRAIDKETLARFEELFKDLNKLFGHD